MEDAKKKIDTSASTASFLELPINHLYPYSAA